ncbi:MAG TPA: 5-formyltetrahydrofolate cyclo-ligase [Steroidobacteraceae bacterium]|nr:5-formyltetrahydrofolate cyclo-ligase [Steroidobacteraceae bacterium]
MRVALPDSTPGPARRALRAELAARRRAVSPAERAAAAARAARHADRALRLKAGQRVAIYCALPTELDSAPLIALAARRGCRIYLPRIDRRRTSRLMRFVERGGPLRRNRLGIDEPGGVGIIGARWLDLVFLPLVGFDTRGLRLGTGGGFYDRAFAYRQLRASWHKPQLVGFGYSFQQVERLTAATHDVLMDAVVTEEGFIRCATG